MIFCIDKTQKRGYNINVGVSQPEMRMLSSELLLALSRKLQVSVSLLKMRKLLNESRAHLLSFFYLERQTWTI